GIGLTICRKVIILMAGEISLSSDIGRGTQITLCIPFRRAAPQTEVSPKREDSAPESSHTTAGKRRILIVEDNKANHIIQQRMMMKLGYGISIAENGEEAVAIAERENFSAILMDLQMPVMDGFEATKKIRASIGDNRSIPIIALTANDGDDVRNQCLDIGMNDYLVKPVKIRRLEECLNHWLK
ncbi:MAG: response regulator, partial [Pseudomonadales bacterium]